LLGFVAHRLHSPTMPDDEGAMKANDIMTKDPSVVTPETTAQEAARLMQSEDVGILPVVDAQGSRRLVGVITDRDIALRVVAEGRSSAQVRDAMSPNVLTARTDDDVKEVMAKMAREQVRRIPIVDDSGMIVGIVAQADIVLEAEDGEAQRTIEQISEPGR
jgi:CBS domain-containing protein